MSDAENQKETYFPSPQVQEAISWKLVAEFHRRHPTGLTIIETHPCGAQYDCLSLLRDGEVFGYLNRGGSLTITGRVEGRIECADLWPRCLSEGGMDRVLNEMSDLCGLSVPTPLPRTGRETLAYRVMAGIIGYLALERTKWEWRNGQEDTADFSDQPHRDAWFEGFPGAGKALRIREDNDVLGIPNYRFWFLLKDGHPQICLSKDAHFWARNGTTLDLFEAYGGNRDFHKVVGKVLGAIG